MKVWLSLLQVLADGRFHSGEALGELLGMSRAAVWKQLRKLQARGINIQAVRGRGYRLPYPIEFLCAESIQAALPDAARALIAGIETFPEIDSTSSYLKSRATQGATSGSVCLAESQGAGRGRQGRTWISPFGCNLYLSLLWRFNAGPGAIAGLSLVVGVALAHALEPIVGHRVGLKWPNDVVWHGEKLAGILVEIAGEASGPSYAVIGIGVNIRMPEDAGGDIDQPWTDLARVCRQPVSRNALAASVLEQVTQALRRFEVQGLDAFLNPWRELDATVGKPIELHLPGRVIGGQAKGIDENGALMIQVGNELRRFASGEVSLRIPS